MATSSILKTFSDSYGTRFSASVPFSLMERDMSFSAGADRGRVLATKNAAPIVSQYSLQTRLRPLYGKGRSSPTVIGDHPDFASLKDSDSVDYCPITTLFMDIESSTRLGLLYPPIDVFRIKNSFITTAIEIINSFDGHVHRIMGDAVMAFFGGKTVKPEQGAIDALNCASVLKVFTEKTVIPFLNDHGYPDAVGIRLGLDYGPREKVLWSSYGFPGVSEVTATSFYVDVASKLQHSAGRNQIMMGQSLREFIDFPSELLDIKQVKRDGKTYEQPYLQPNLATKDGMPVNYQQFILNAPEYLKASPLAQTDAKKYLLPAEEVTYSPMVSVEVLEMNGEQIVRSLGSYFPSASMLPKHRQLQFKVIMPVQPPLPYEINFEVENHGEEARVSGERQGRSPFDNHGETVTISTMAEHNNIVHEETTLFRGLHFLNVRVSAANGKGMTRLGVYVQ